MKRLLGVLLLLVAIPAFAQFRHVIVDNTVTTTCTNCGGSAPVLAADGTANPTIPQNSVFPFFFNGTTWDRARGDLTSGMWVNIKNAFPAALAGNGGLKVECLSGCGGAAAFDDNSAFTFGGTDITNIGLVFDDTSPNAVTENNSATPRISSNRNIYFQLRDGLGNERGASVTATNALKVDGSAVTQPVSGTFWQATQPVSGTFWQGTQPVSGTVTANAGTGTFTVGDGSGPLTVDGTVTANAGTNLNTSALALESGGNLASIAAEDFATQTTLATRLSESAFTSSASGSQGTINAGTLAATTTAAQVAANVTAVQVLVQNDPDNTVDVLCGNASTQPIQLKPGDGLTLNVTNVNLIWCKTASSTGTVAYVAR